MANKAVIFDLDGTIFDCRHRQHHVRNKDWNSFYAGIKDDTPIWEIVDLAKALMRQNNHIIFCSGRPEDYREVTQQGLKDVDLRYHDGLYMRASGDFRPDHVVKSQLLDGIIADGFEPWLVVDDRPSVVAMWRERGLMCLQVNNTWESNAPAEKPGLLTLMVGPSGAGKSTWLKSDEAREKFRILPSHIISSDEMRQDICDDFRDQTQNERVFAAVHAQAKARIQNGAPAVIDATNIRRADRLACVNLANGGPVRYIVIDRPMIEKIRDAGWRSELPFDLLAKHAQTFGSNLKDILAGDSQPNVTVIDLRK